MATQSQPEPQSERAAVQLTRSEKADLRLVSVSDQITESSLLREKTIDEIVARAAEIRRRIAEPAESGAAS